MWLMCDMCQIKEQMARLAELQQIAQHRERILQELTLVLP